jgi:hypothetical protein
MAKSSYFLPATDAGFGAFFGNFCNQGARNPSGQSPVLANIPAGAAAILHAAYTVRHGAYEKTLVPHAPLETEVKNEAKAAAKAKIRPFVNVYLREGQRAVTNGAPGRRWGA